jgi:thioredoxin 1
MQTILIILAILLIVFVVYVYRAQAKLKATPMVADSDTIMTLTDKNFKHQTKDKIVLVDFWASWCAPCRMMAPILNDLSHDLTDNKHIGKVNIEEYPTLAQMFKVRNIPTMIVFKNGVEINRIVGVKSKEYLMKQLQNS